MQSQIIIIALCKVIFGKRISLCQIILWVQKLAVQNAVAGILEVFQSTVLPDSFQPAVRKNMVFGRHLVWTIASFPHIKQMEHKVRQGVSHADIQDIINTYRKLLAVLPTKPFNFPDIKSGILHGIANKHSHKSLAGFLECFR